MKNDIRQVVKVRLFLEGKVIEYDMPGPLVTMRPAPAKSPKGEGGKRA